MATLLSLTQDILSEINGDEVNSITDTEESEQVAKIIRKVYEAMMSRSVWPHTRQGTDLVARGDTDYPTHMSLPTNVKELVSVNYDKRLQGETRKKYEKVLWKEPDDFLRWCNHRDSSVATTQVVENDDGIELLIANNNSPTYFTSFNDVDLIFDSFDSTVDSTLQESKVQAIAYVIPEFAYTDDAVPSMPPDALSGLYEESLSRSSLKINEVQDIKAEQESLKQSRYLSRNAWRTNKTTRYPSYGRKK